MDDLTKLFSSMLPPDMMAETERLYNRDISLQSNSIRTLPPDPVGSSSKLNVNDLDTSNPERFQETLLESISGVKPAFPPLESLPCANVEVEKYRACPNPGTMACSACKLVSYCSRECQKLHWRHHKQDCKNRLRSEDWTPAWVAESRPPSFVDYSSTTFGEEFNQKRKEEFSVGVSLWGNMPAMDIVNLSINEKDSKRDLSLAYVASGDLRHVVCTINALPSDYSGKLDILINDATTPVTFRNIVLLLILGTISDEVMAADIALHFWYSTFMPIEYRLRISTILTQFLKDGPMVSSFPLGPNSTLSSLLPRGAVQEFLHYVSSSISLGDVQDEYDRVRGAPSRRDFRERMYARLRPSHRVAFQEFRRFGIVLPFGAANAHFNDPNLSLFSPEGKWLQTDYADPLEGWDLDRVIGVGKARGAQVEDIYGCLYFFLSQQLRTFARRIRQFRISFNVYNAEACGLSRAIRDGSFSQIGLPSSMRFDRVEVSNILDANYVGMEAVLTHWGPLLVDSNTAAIVGYFMNWPALQNDGIASGAGRDVTTKLLRQLMEKRMGSKKNRKPSLKEIQDMQSMMYLIVDDMNAIYENSKPFMKFLKKQGLDGVLRKSKLRLREAHTIAPHRIKAPFGAKPDALPKFPDDDSWYYHTQLTCFTWLERFVEFTRA